MPNYEVWDSATEKLVFVETAPDLEVAIWRAKNTIKLYTNYNSINPDAILVCEATGENTPNWKQPSA